MSLDISMRAKKLEKCPHCGEPLLMSVVDEISISGSCFHFMIDTVGYTHENYGKYIPLTHTQVYDLMRRTAEENLGASDSLYGFLGRYNTNKFVIEFEADW